MAELGIAASIVGIASAGARLSTSLYTFAETASWAGNSVKAIALEISLVSAVLEQLGDNLKQDVVATICSSKGVEMTQTIVRECSEVYTEIDAALQKSISSARKNPNPSKGQKIVISLSERLKWPFLQPKMQLLSGNLERLKLTLLLMLNVLLYGKKISEENRKPTRSDFDWLQIEELLAIKERATWNFEDLERTLGHEERATWNFEELERTLGHEDKPLEGGSDLELLPVSTFPPKRLNSIEQLDQDKNASHNAASNPFLSCSSRPPFAAGDTKSSNMKLTSEEVTHGTIRSLLNAVNRTQQRLDEMASLAQSSASPATSPEGPLLILDPGTAMQAYVYFPTTAPEARLRGNGLPWSENETRRLNRFQRRIIQLNTDDDAAPMPSNGVKRGTSNDRESLPGVVRFTKDGETSAVYVKLPLGRTPKRPRSPTDDETALSRPVPVIPTDDQKELQRSIPTIPPDKRKDAPKPRPRRYNRAAPRGAYWKPRISNPLEGKSNPEIPPSLTGAWNSLQGTIGPELGYSGQKDQSVPDIQRISPTPKPPPVADRENLESTSTLVPQASLDQTSAKITSEQQPHVSQQAVQMKHLAPDWDQRLQKQTESDMISSEPANVSFWSFSSTEASNRPTGHASVNELLRPGRDLTLKSFSPRGIVNSDRLPVAQTMLWPARSKPLSEQIPSPDEDCQPCSLLKVTCDRKKPQCSNCLEKGHFCIKVQHRWVNRRRYSPRDSALGGTGCVRCQLEGLHCEKKEASCSRCLTDGTPCVSYDTLRRHIGPSGGEALPVTLGDFFRQERGQMARPEEQVKASDMPSQEQAPSISTPPTRFTPSESGSSSFKNTLYPPSQWESPLPSEPTPDHEPVAAFHSFTKHNPGNQQQQSVVGTSTNKPTTPIPLMDDFGTWERAILIEYGCAEQGPPSSGLPESWAQSQVQAVAQSKTASPTQQPGPLDPSDTPSRQSPLMDGVRLRSGKVLRHRALYLSPCEQCCQLHRPCDDGTPQCRRCEENDTPCSRDPLAFQRRDDALSAPAPRPRIEEVSGAEDLRRKRQRAATEEPISSKNGSKASVEFLLSEWTTVQL
ncbi:MAG: hypothetical protein M1823_005846 [Watsoniomyces obsoletus]|nr:MAG: hypothetical protein M1823_005846 [Watsoniomyces obsoletus]